MPLNSSPRAATAGLLRAAGLVVVVLTCLVVASTHADAAPAGQAGLPGETIFQQKCIACHTIGGGRLVGPDLEGATDRRDPAWLKAFIAAPDKVLASGDPLAAQLLKESNNVPMPNLGLSAQEVDAVLQYLAAQGGTAVGNTAGAAQPTPTPVTMVAQTGDAPQGMLLFTGQVALQRGGTPCIACHSVEGAGLLGGGALGPDLTQVHARYGGDQGLGAALAGLPFPSMQSIFANKQLTPAEQADLLVYFAAADQEGRTPLPRRNLLVILGVGAGLAGALFAGMAFFWPRQRMSIAQRLRKYGKL